MPTRALGTIKHNMTEASDITGLVGVAIAVEEDESVTCSEITKRARFYTRSSAFIVR